MLNFFLLLERKGLLCVIQNQRKKIIILFQMIYLTTNM